MSVCGDGGESPAIKQLGDRTWKIDQLASELTIHEAAALVAKIHEKNTKNKGERFSLYPVQNWGAFERLKRLESGRWTADEIEFVDDINDFKELPKNEQRPLIMSFGFFAVGDGSIAGAIAYRMILVARTFEQQSFFVCQLDNERTHGETYGKMIWTLIPDKTERDEIFQAVENVKSIQAMNQFIEDTFTTPEGERTLYVMLACAEYLMFTPLFCIIFWYRAYRRGKLKRTVFSNEQIAKDEALHCLNACECYKDLPVSERYTDSQVQAIVARVVALVDKFAEETLDGVNLTDLTAANVKLYIRVVADDLLIELDHAPLYNVENPFPWMEFLRLRNKTNFYEGTPGEYSRFNVKNAIRTAARFSGLAIEESTKKQAVFTDANGEVLF
jgi:ribonucleoside-diphosphate reductase beta chain